MIYHPHVYTFLSLLKLFIGNNIDIIDAQASGLSPMQAQEEADGWHHLPGNWKQTNINRVNNMFIEKANIIKKLLIRGFNTKTIKKKMQTAKNLNYGKH